MSAFRRFFSWRSRWRRESPPEETPRETALLPRAMLSVLEDVMAWENPHLSLGFLGLVNVLFLVFAYLRLSVLELVFVMGMAMTCLDGLETYLRHKHRTACLESLAQCGNTRLSRGLVRARRWLIHRTEDFLAMREANPTKAFLLVNIILGCVLVLGKAVSGALLLYLLTMAVVLFPVASPPLMRFVKKIHQVAESDEEMDALIPELSEQNIKELSFASEAPVEKTRQSVEPWLPEGAPPGDTSDSDSDSQASDHLPATDAALDPKDSSDSSEDEYLPQSAAIEPRLQTTVEILPPAPVAWSESAVGALWSLGGALSGLMTRAPPPTSSETGRKRFSSADSSEDFEFVDQTDL